ncbi:MAG: hypothetical protein LBI60_06160 [Bacteroidales bacterium]|jgi:hypothetical protein|nr:hypothetical protein [Bacteroidales bacterium]
MKKKCLIIAMSLFVYFVQAQNYSIAKRWNIKAGYSRSTYGVSSTEKWGKKTSSNYRIEANYGVLSCLEVGLYAGIITHPLYKYKATEIYYRNDNPQDSTIDYLVDQKTTVAPIFGLQVNFHILPLFVKKEDCRWDLYVSAKYGGCYLVKGNISSDLLNVMREQYPNQPVNSFAKTFKQEYGIGIGGSVYFWKVFGLYTECSFGQYGFFTNPEVKTTYTLGNNFNIRGGFTCKW